MGQGPEGRGKYENRGNEAKKSLKTKDLTFFTVQKRTENVLVLHANRSKQTPKRTTHLERGEAGIASAGRRS